MNRFLNHNELWPSITKATAQKTSITAAIAYLTDANALPLKAGDVLISDLSPRSIETGNSSAKAVQTLFNRGVQLFSNDKLHAKVILLGTKELVVGSMNASRSSQFSLIEAGYSAKDAGSIDLAASWLAGLREASTPIDKAELTRLLKIVPRATQPYHLANVVAGGRDIQRPKRRTWVIYGSYDGVDYTHVDENSEIVASSIGKPKFQGYHLDCIEIFKREARSIQEGDCIVYIHEWSPKLIRVYPPVDLWQVIPEEDGFSLHYMRRKHTSARPIRISEFKGLLRSWKCIFSYGRTNRLPNQIADQLKSNWSNLGLDYTRYDWTF